MDIPRLESVTVRGYRSLLDVRLDVGPVTVVQGGNGSGKSNLYRALGLAHAAATGSLARTIAAEGGMGSILWAGARRRGPRRVEIEVQWVDLRYTLSMGVPQALGDDPFPLDPEVKSETIEVAAGGRWLTVAERTNSSAMMRDDDGDRVVFPFDLWRGESLLSQVRDPRGFPIAAEVSARLADWRMYHEFRTGDGAPARSPQLGVYTAQLADDGADLAAAFATIRHFADVTTFHARVADAFAGARVAYEVDAAGRFSLTLDTGLNRPLAASELSDGTLRFLCLLTALSSPRPASFVAFNEPEASLHPDLLPAVADALAQRTHDSQIWLTTHSAALADLMSDRTGVMVHRLERADGATRVVA